MSVLLRGFIFAAGLLLIFASVRSMVRRSFTERQTLFWIFSGLVLMVVSLFPTIAYLIADVFGVDYVPSIFFAIAILLAIYGIFYCYKAIAMLQNRVNELAMQVSMLNQENFLLQGEERQRRIEDVCKSFSDHGSEQA